MSTHRPETASPAVPTPATTPHPRARPIPRKIKDAIEALRSGKARNLTQAAKCAGISRVHLSRTLSRRPDIVTWATNRMARTLGIGASVAGAQMLDLIHSNSSRVSFEASRHVLSLAGIAPANQPQVSVNVEVKAGWVIDLAPETEAERQAIERERERQAKIINAEPIEPKQADD